MIRVVVVDDHPVVLDGFVRLLEADDEIEVVGSASDGSAAVLLDADLEPDVVLMDLVMHGIDGIEATRAITTVRPAARVVMMSGSCEPASVLGAFDAGAIGYLLKDEEPWQVVAGVRAAAAGGAPLDPDAGAILLEERRARQEAVHLSPRELEVLRLASTGLLNKQIAREIGISEKTVKAHLGHVYERLGVTGRSGAVTWAQEHAVLDREAPAVDDPPPGSRS